MTKHKLKELCHECNERPIQPPLGMCQNCWADGVVVMDAFMKIMQDHGIVKALAARPILAKAIKTGWKEEYLAEYEANLAERVARKGEVDAIV